MTENRFSLYRGSNKPVREQFTIVTQVLGNHFPINRPKEMVSYGGSERVAANLIEGLRTYRDENGAHPFQVEAWVTNDSYRRKDGKAKSLPGLTIVRSEFNGFGPQPTFSSNGQTRAINHRVLREIRDTNAQLKAGKKVPLKLYEFHDHNDQLPVIGQDPEVALSTIARYHNVPDLAMEYHNPLDKAGAANYPDVPRIMISHTQMRSAGFDNQSQFPFVKVVHNGLDESGFKPNFKPAPDAPAVFLGRFSPAKNPMGSIRVALAAGVPIKLAGNEDAENPQCFQDAMTAKDKEGEAKIQYVGTVGDAYDPSIGMSSKSHFLGNARAFIGMGEWPEPFGLMMIEAMACGTPVIAFDAPGSAVHEIVQHGVTGFIVKSEAEAVECLKKIDSIDRRAVRKHFIDNFSSAVMVEKTVEVYRDLAAYRRDRLGRSAPALAKTFKIA